VSNILEPLFQILTEEEMQHAYSQQDNAAAHAVFTNTSSQHFMLPLRDISGNRMISWVLWPPRSPDFSVYDFYLREKQNRNVYRNNPCIVEALEFGIGSLSGHQFEPLF
jgi:hypothetical protein